MQIGIGLPNAIRGAEGRLLVRWARLAEERGFSTLGTIDRVAFPSYESLVALAAAAAATERIGLLTDILLAPTRNPILLAKEAASVDQLSGGRLTLGLGVGAREDDFVATQREYRNRGRRFEGDLELIHGAWRGELVGGCPQPPTPRPVRGDRVPILIGGSTDKAIERAVRWGIGWTAGGSPSTIVGPFAERVRQAWRDAGREGEPKIAALTYFSLGDDHRDQSAANMRDYYGTQDWVDGMIERTPKTPDAAREAAARFEAADVDELLFFPTVADLDQVDGLADAVL